MPTPRETILSSPVDVKALKAGGAAQAIVARQLYDNFLGYASAHWTYASTSGALKATSLLDGSGGTAPACGTLREALKIMMREDLGLTNEEAKNADINGAFVTRGDLRCFDARVTGNVCPPPPATTYDFGCLFVTHYFLEVMGTFYDPCLSAVYTSAAGPIRFRLRKIDVPGSVAGLWISADYAYIFKNEPGKTLPGFNSVYKSMRLFECKNSLTSDEFKAVEAFSARMMPVGGGAKK